MYSRKQMHDQRLLIFLVEDEMVCVVNVTLHSRTLSGAWNVWDLLCGPRLPCDGNHWAHTETVCVCVCVCVWEGEGGGGGEGMGGQTDYHLRKLEQHLRTECKLEITQWIFICYHKQLITMYVLHIIVLHIVLHIGCDIYGYYCHWVLQKTSQRKPCSLPPADRLQGSRALETSCHSSCGLSPAWTGSCKDSRETWILHTTTKLWSLAWKVISLYWSYV